MLIGALMIPRRKLERNGDAHSYNQVVWGGQRIAGQRLRACPARSASQVVQTHRQSGVGELAVYPDYHG